MNDEQLITLLRDVPLPNHPVDRYAAVQTRGRRQDRRRTTVLAASLAAVVVAGAATALTWKGRPSADPQTFLKATTSAGTAHITGSLAFGGQRQTYVGDVDFTHNAAGLTISSAGQEIEIRSIGDDVYIRGFAPGFGSGAPAGKHWMHSSSSSGTTSNVAAFDPGRILDVLRTQHATLDAQGHEDINGVRTTDYLVSGARTSGKGPFSSGTGHLFVGDDGLVRRITFTEDSYDTAGTGTRRAAVSAVTTMDFSDYGKRVDIVAPPASDTFEASGFATSVGSSSSGTAQTITLTPQPMDAAAKARVCQLVKGQLAKATQIPQARKDALIKEICGK